MTIARRLFALPLAATFVVSACGGDAPASESQAPIAGTAVRVESPRIQEVAEVIEITGRLAAASERPLAFKVPGYVASVEVRAGESVGAGQLLARLRTDEVDAAVTAAEVDVEQARRAVGRLTRLFADSVVARSQLEDAEDALARAQAALQVAEFNRAQSEVRAPEAGRVLERYVEPDQWAQPGQPAFGFAGSSRGWIVEVALTDQEAVRADLGTVAEVIFDAFPEETFTGRLTEIAAGATPGTGLYRAEITLDSPPGGLRSGFVGRVRILPDSRVARLHLPPEAVADVEDGIATIYTVEDGDRASAHRVRLLGFADGDLLATGDLSEDARLVTLGAAFLRDGELVTIVEGLDR